MQSSAVLWTAAHRAPLVHRILQVRILVWVAIPFSVDVNLSKLRDMRWAEELRTDATVCGVAKSQTQLSN